MLHSPGFLLTTSSLSTQSDGGGGKRGPNEAHEDVDGGGEHDPYETEKKENRGCAGEGGKKKKPETAWKEFPID